MQLGQVARLMAGFAALFTVAQIPPLVCALSETHATALTPVTGFTVSIAAGSCVSLLLWLLGRGRPGQAYRKETIAVAGLSWFLAGVLGAVPLAWSGLLPEPVDALFESLSGLTTCGATVLGSGDNPGFDEVPGSLLLWRALLQWIGGVGVVLLFVALLPAMGITAKNLILSESIGVGTDSFQPRAIGRARVVVGIYVSLTLACTVLLVAIGGFGWFDATCHAFTTLSTGGFSTRSSIAEFDSLGGEIVIMVFMFLGGTSLGFIATRFRTHRRGLSALLRTGEFRIYATATVAVVVLCTLGLLRAGLPFGTALRQASFNGISILTSTGYATANFQCWPTAVMLVLFGAMLVGGCSGSTSGGFKQVRLLVILRLFSYTLRHFIRPKSVERIKLDEEVLPAAVISSILAIVLLWLLTILGGALVLSLDPRMNFVSSLSVAASMMGSTGPAMTIVDPGAGAEALRHGGAAATLAGMADVGPLGGYGELRPWTKFAQALLMVLGRLELLTVLALFAPVFWRR